MAMNYTPEFYREWRFWDKYNDPNAPDKSNATVRDEYLRDPFAAPPPNIRQAAPIAVPPAPGAIIPQAIVAPTPAERNLYMVPALAPRGISGTGTPKLWKGTKILGTGASGSVILWQWSRESLRVPGYKGTLLPLDIAVKTITAVENDLTYEGGIMQNLTRLGSPHITRLLAPPKALNAQDRRREALDNTWHQKVRRLIMEYCPQGSILTLLRRRIARQVHTFPFSELTLWMIFECMVDGIGVLDYGAEVGYDPATGLAVLPAFDAARPVGVHFDMKPGNIMAGNRTVAHPELPLYKIGDFGTYTLQDRMPPPLVPAADWATNEELRAKGTDGYYAPEQFSARWNNADYAASPVCGQYSSATNIWGVGVIMYQLICLDFWPPDHTQPFMPGFNIQGAPAQGILYGVGQPRPLGPAGSPPLPPLVLQQQSYSAQLKDLVHECLYEIPAQRPTLATLKQTIAAQMALLVAGGATVDEWFDMETPDPAAVDISKAIARAAAGGPQVEGIAAGRSRRRPSPKG
ncbi:uncharacterized protein L3040_007380 [Drepanopeziza brunnea f. sp. 'multigermtubi']|uniref:uncharacterized protein n=1 Tax=Drepanopeziza brunnea f. sp. 'multigermtubi' TaxID=698441 RepID=UPI00238FDFDB|nr:hypothetical protein L3040_007380 [Drepanopeziza brunnea f. sp. 'multigermtubi']